jgi:hypothetical protein
MLPHYSTENADNSKKAYISILHTPQVISQTIQSIIMA